jgi:muramoyltetrapeptide carboxypeptidase
MGLGHVDRQFTMLANAGHLKGLQGVAVGQFTNFGTQSDWTIIDVLRDRLSRYDVPILGGLPFGHGKNPRTIPIGTIAALDAERGTLNVLTGARPYA